MGFRHNAFMKCIPRITLAATVAVFSLFIISQPWPPTIASAQSSRPVAEKAPAKNTSERGTSKKSRKATSRPASQPTSAPADPPVAPEVETIAEFVRRTERSRTAPKSDAERARVAALQFLAAVARADGEAAAARLDVVGYQPLPLSGGLPNPPVRPQTIAEFKRWLETQPARPWGAWRAIDFVVKPRSEMAESHAPAAQWMLPEDFALIYQPDENHPPAAGAAATIPIDLDAGCLVVRVRGPKATIIGGSWFEAALR